MRAKLTIPEEELLRYALIGYQARRAEIDAAMLDIRSRMEPAATNSQPKSRRAAPRRRHLSPEGRAAIIAGVKRRWAKIRRRKRMEGPGRA
jgi:hypothetical protein